MLQCDLKWFRDYRLQIRPNDWTAHLHGVSIRVFVLGVLMGQLNRSGNHGLLYHHSLCGHGVAEESLDAALVSSNLEDVRM